MLTTCGIDGVTNVQEDTTKFDLSPSPPKVVIQVFIVRGVNIAIMTSDKLVMNLSPKRGLFYPYYLTNVLLR